MHRTHVLRIVYLLVLLCLEKGATAACINGTYGEDCKQGQTCYCRSRTGCDPISGACPEGPCLEGYRDEPYCNIAYPLLKAFFIRALDEERIEVSWRPWNPQRGDTGKGNPDGYIIRYKVRGPVLKKQRQALIGEIYGSMQTVPLNEKAEQKSKAWARTALIPKSGYEMLSFVVTQLRPNTLYEVQVLVHDVSGHMHSETARTASVITPCGAPLSAPHSFRHKEMTDGGVKLTWQLPERSQGQCGNVSAELTINGASPRPATGRQEYIFKAMPNTRYRVQARLTTKPGKAGPWSDVYEFTTSEAVAKNKGVYKVSKRSNVVTAETQESLPIKNSTIGRPTLSAAISSLLIVVVLAVGAVCWWKWQQKRRKDYGGQKKRLKKLRGELVLPMLKTPATPRKYEEENDKSGFEMVETSGAASETTSKPLRLSDLQGYIQRMLASDGLKSEFMNQPKGRQHPALEAQRTENKDKNRYRNLLPYDHSRVKLKPIPGELCSDYINANHIDGHWSRYIATQGPKPNTVDDFWRMVWQMNVCKIVMLTNLVENGKAKCDKYWPDMTASYGEIQVKLVGGEEFPDYAIRQFHITLEDTTREIKQFHLTSWPDNGVPLYPNTVLTFRRKVNQYRPYNETPVVVHCSAGVGRTGAYILLDNLLEQAQSEGVVDVVGQLSAIRTSRMNLVETVEQYYFVHRALIESLYGHSIPCNKMNDHYRQLLSVDKITRFSGIVKEFDELNFLKSRLTPADLTTTSDRAHLGKSRDTSSLAPDRRRPLLQNGTFVNAVYVNSCYRKNKFLVTQTPSSKDVGDFWKLVIESGSRTIVTLDVFNEDSDVAPFWPTEGSVRYGDHKIKRIENCHANDMSVHVFEVTSKHKGFGSSGRVEVRHFHQPTCNSVEQMVDLVKQVELWQQELNDQTILVQCRNGWTASGLFCCCALVLEKIKCEQEVDVFFATRIVRENRPQFISDCDQYKFCYDAAVAYLKSS